MTHAAKSLPTRSSGFRFGEIGNRVATADVILPLSHNKEYASMTDMAMTFANVAKTTLSMPSRKEGYMARS